MSRRVDPSTMPGPRAKRQARVIEAWCRPPGHAGAAGGVVSSEAPRKRDEEFMAQALAEAEAAAREAEVPVGAVVVCRGAVVGQGRNRREALAEPTGHAEVLAMRDAARARASWHLDDCTLYVTLEPCVMCAGAIVQARIERLVFGCPDPKGGAVRSLYRICDDPRLNHRVAVTEGVLGERCSAVLRGFFTALREK